MSNNNFRCFDCHQPINIKKPHIRKPIDGKIALHHIKCFGDLSNVVPIKAGNSKHVYIPNPRTIQKIRRTNPIETPLHEWERALEEDKKMLKKYESSLKKLQQGKKVGFLTIDSALNAIEGLKAVIKNKQKFIKSKKKTANPVSQKRLKKAMIGEGWAIQDYTDLMGDATPKELEALKHIRDEEVEHFDELLELKKNPGKIYWIFYYDRGRFLKTNFPSKKQADSYAGYLKRGGSTDIKITVKEPQMGIYVSPKLTQDDFKKWSIAMGILEKVKNPQSKFKEETLKFGTEKWKQTENERQISFIRMGRTIESVEKEDYKIPGIIAIQKTPQVDMDSAQLTGYTYSLITSLKYSKRKRFNNRTDAIKHAKTLMNKYAVMKSKMTNPKDSYQRRLEREAKYEELDEWYDLGLSDCKEGHNENEPNYKFHGDGAVDEYWRGYEQGEEFEQHGTKAKNNQKKNPKTMAVAIDKKYPERGVYWAIFYPDVGVDKKRRFKTEEMANKYIQRILKKNPTEKIEGWRKTDKDFWESVDDERLSIDYVEHEIEDKHWVVTVVTPEYMHMEIIYEKAFKTKKEATKHAIEWMKEHPKGNSTKNPKKNPKQLKWSPSQLWSVMKKSGVPMDERQTMLDYYLETGKLPYDTYPKLKMIKDYPAPPHDIWLQKSRTNPKSLKETLDLIKWYFKDAKNFLDKAKNAIEKKEGNKDYFFEQADKQINSGYAILTNVLTDKEQKKPIAKQLLQKYKNILSYWNEIKDIKVSNPKQIRNPNIKIKKGEIAKLINSYKNLKSPKKSFFDYMSGKVGMNKAIAIMRAIEIKEWKFEKDFGTSPILNPKKVYEIKEKLKRTLKNSEDAFKNKDYFNSYIALIEAGVFGQTLSSKDIPLKEEIKLADRINNIREKLRPKVSKIVDLIVAGNEYASNPTNGTVYRARGIYPKTGKDSYITTVWRDTKEEAEKDIGYFGHAYTDTHIVSKPRYGKVILPKIKSKPVETTVKKIKKALKDQFGVTSISVKKGTGTVSGWVEFTPTQTSKFTRKEADAIMCLLNLQYPPGGNHHSLPEHKLPINLRANYNPKQTSNQIKEFIKQYEKRTETEITDWEFYRGYLIANIEEYGSRAYIIDVDDTTYGISRKAIYDVDSFEDAVDWIDDAGNYNKKYKKRKYYDKTDSFIKPNKYNNNPKSKKKKALIDRTTEIANEIKNRKWEELAHGKGGWYFLVNWGKEHRNIPKLLPSENPTLIKKISEAIGVDLAKLTSIKARASAINTYLKKSMKKLNKYEKNPISGNVKVNDEKKGLISISWNNEKEWIQIPVDEWGYDERRQLIWTNTNSGNVSIRELYKTELNGKVGTSLWFNAPFDNQILFKSPQVYDDFKSILKKKYSKFQQNPKTTKKVQKYFHVCMDCGKTVSEVNEDGECSKCVAETEKNREKFMKNKGLPETKITKTVQKYFNWIEKNVWEKSLIPTVGMTDHALVEAFPELQLVQAQDLVNRFNEMKMKNQVKNPSLPPELQYIEKLARKYNSSSAFIKAVQQGKSITIGSPIKAKGLAHAGWVVGEGTIARGKIPVWKIELPGTKEISQIPKDEAVEMHGIADLETLWEVATENKMVSNPYQKKHIDINITEVPKLKTIQNITINIPKTLSDITLLNQYGKLKGAKTAYLQNILSDDWYRGGIIGGVSGRILKDVWILNNMDFTTKEFEKEIKARNLMSDFTVWAEFSNVPHTNPYQKNKTPIRNEVSIKDLIKGNTVAYLDSKGAFRSGTITKIYSNAFTIKDAVKKKRKIPKENIIAKYYRKGLYPIKENKHLSKYVENPFLETATGLLAGIATTTFAVGIVGAIVGGVVANWINEKRKAEVAPSGYSIPDLEPPKKWIKHSAKQLLSSGMTDQKKIEKKIINMWNTMGYDDKLYIYNKEYGVSAIRTVPNPEKGYVLNAPLYEYKGLDSEDLEWKGVDGQKVARMKEPMILKKDRKTFRTLTKSEQKELKDTKHLKLKNGEKLYRDDAILIAPKWHKEQFVLDAEERMETAKESVEMEKGTWTTPINEYIVKKRKQHKPIWKGKYGRYDAGNEYNDRKFHKIMVEKALSFGKKVPEKVLKDYPDLMPKAITKKVEAPKPKVEKTTLPPLKEGEKYHIVHRGSMMYKTTDPKKAMDMLKVEQAILTKYNYKTKAEIVPAKNIAHARKIIWNRGKSDYEVSDTEYGDRHDMRRYGLRWDRQQQLWRGKLSPQKAKELGEKFTVEKSEDEFSEAERKEQFKKKQSDKADRYRELARKAEAKSEQKAKQSSAITDQIPFGQPILVGHHSEKRHRRALARVHSLESKRFEEMDKAEEYRRKADNLDRMAGTTKGDAERRKEIERKKQDTLIGKGSRVNDFAMGGLGTVIRVNKKTYTIQFDNGEKYSRDKRHVTLVKNGEEMVKKNPIEVPFGGRPIHFIRDAYTGEHLDIAGTEEEAIEKAKKLANKKDKHRMAILKLVNFYYPDLKNNIKKFHPNFNLKNKIKKNPSLTDSEIKLMKKTFKDFHDFDHKKIRNVKFPEPKCLVRIGGFKAIGYRSNKWTGNNVDYIHEWEKKPSNKGVVAVDPTTDPPTLIAWTQCQVRPEGITDV